MKKYAFGVDIGGTTCKIGFFETNGTLLDKWEIKTNRENNGASVLSDVAHAVEGKLEKEGISKDDVQGIGIGVPGPVKKESIVNRCVNIGWGVVNVAEEMKNLTGLDIKVGNDANVAALGEMWQGGAKGSKDVVLVTLGTGVGGGVIVNGKVVSGFNGAGGEIGHITVDHDEAEQCTCGQYGCLEQYASATGIVRLAKRRLDADNKDSVLRQGEVSAKTVFDAVKAGDEVACEIAEQFGQYLGKGLAAIAAVVNPEAFVIGGGVSKAGDILCQYITKYYEKYAFHGCKNAQFKLATLGNDAGIYGAAKLVL